MSDGQKTTFELLIVLGLLIVFASSHGRGFWQTLFTKQDYKIDPPKLVWPTYSLPGGVTVGGGPVFPVKAGG